jgi:hypothetical protein
VPRIELEIVKLEESKEISEFGLYPTILKDLFAQRAQMKKELFIYKEKKENIESEHTDYLDDPVYKECLFMLKYCGCVEDKKEIEELQVQFLDLCKDGLLELIQPLLEKANESIHCSFG